MKSQWILAGSVVGILLLRPVTSLACGGCFHPPPTDPMMQNMVASVVTDHRMAFSISKTQTVLWDQVQYQGNPTEFAWVLPVHAGAKLELSHDAWLAALDAGTRSIIKSPAYTCPPPPPNATGYASGGGSYYGGGGGGCGGGDDTSSSRGFGIDASYDPGGQGMDGGQYMDGNGVMVLEQSVVGPYSVVTLRASNGDALGPWLRANGFEIPMNVDPIVKAYDTEGFDFIAMRLKPGANVRAMQPVRVTTPGADPTLPLRMVTAGVGANVGLTLWVISEGRYEPANFPKETIGGVSWFGNQSRSNYSELSIAIMAKHDGYTWLVESATDGNGSTNPFQPSVVSAYQSVCTGKSEKVAVPCPSPDAGSDASSDADADADTDADSDASSQMASDAGADAGCFQTVNGCTSFDDWAVATKGLYPIVITRMRSVLPVAALATDLKLGASYDQSPLSNVIQTVGYADQFDPCPKYTTADSGASNSSSYDHGGCSCETTGGRNTASSVATGSIAALVLASFLRRRRR